MREEKGALIFGVTLGLVGLVVYARVRRWREVRGDVLADRLSNRLGQLERHSPPSL